MANILLVEDNQDDVLLIKIAFESLNMEYSLVVASKGQDALQLLEKIAKEKISVDLILLDINLPGVNGLEILEEIREHPYTKKIPVVMFSSTDLESDMLKSHQLGADFFIRKPNNITDYKKVLTQLNGLLIRS